MNNHNFQHDIKNNLTGIISAINTIKDNYDNRELTFKILDEIANRSKSTLTLVTEQLEKND